MIGMLIDVTRCIGCQKCVDACVGANKLGRHIPAPQHVGDGLSETRWTSVVSRPANRYVKMQCRHCLSPACASACLVGAMRKTPEGQVVYDKKKCMGCRYCMMACPYGIPRYEWQSAVPYVQKCTMCHERVTEGQLPACVEACPAQALLFGKRKDLLDEAKGRIQSGDSKYLPRVFGEHEVGGSSVLYVSDIPLSFLGRKKDLGNNPLPDLTWASLKKVPAEFLGMGALMTGIHWITRRRQVVRDQEDPGTPDNPPQEEANKDE